MQNINKKNFFDTITKKYPSAMIKFHEWIDAYKVSVDWDKLFGVKYEVVLPDREDIHYKFHDIPYEMQFGILLKFVAEVLDDAGINEQVIGVDEMKLVLECCFNELQQKLKPDVTDLQEQDLNNIRRHGQSSNE